VLYSTKLTNEQYIISGKRSTHTEVGRHLNDHFNVFSSLVSLYNRRTVCVFFDDSIENHAANTYHNCVEPSLSFKLSRITVKVDFSQFLLHNIITHSSLLLISTLWYCSSKHGFSRPGFQFLVSKNTLRQLSFLLYNEKYRDWHVPTYCKRYVRSFAKERQSSWQLISDHTY